MGAAREGANIWWMLFHRYPGGQWFGWDIPRALRSHYFWHDSFGKFWKRLTGCNHPEPRKVNDPGEADRWYCFDCERDVPS